MHIDVLTLFPEMIDSYFSQSLLGAAQDKGLLEIKTHNFRSAAVNKHNSVDDSPFGGGAGMVLSPQPVFDYVAQNKVARPIVYLTPTGSVFDQSKAQELSELDSFTLLCGRYEGIDERIRTNLIDEEISIGDYVLAGGEPAAIVVAEAVGRLVPGVLGNGESVETESFSTGLLEHPHFTRPADFNGLKVPEELLSGDHKLIADWRMAQSLFLTAKKRPDLIEARGGLTSEEELLLEQFDLRV